MYVSWKLDWSDPNYGIGPEDDFKKIGHCVFDKDQWYAYNVSQCHSVENITGTRYFLSVTLANNPNYKVDDLINTTNITGQLVNLWNN